MPKIKTEANTDTGIAVGLIDSMLTSAKVLRKMMDESLKREINKNNKSKNYSRPFNDLERDKALQESIKNFYLDRDVKHLLILGIKYTKEKIIL